MGNQVVEGSAELLKVKLVVVVITTALTAEAEGLEEEVAAFHRDDIDNNNGRSLASITAVLVLLLVSLFLLSLLAFEVDSLASPLDGSFLQRNSHRLLTGSISNSPTTTTTRGAAALAQPPHAADGHLSR